MSKVEGCGERLAAEDELPDAVPYDAGGPDEAAAFIAEMASGLSKMAERNGLSVLTHLLEMTQLEARDWLRSKRRLS